MSVSSRSTKAVMYSEIERLRALLDLREQQIDSLEDTVRRLEAKVEELSAALSASQPSAAPRSEPTLSDRGTRIQMMKRLAITCKATVKWDDDRGFLQYKDGSWIAVPTRTVEFVAKGLAA